MEWNNASTPIMQDLDKFDQANTLHKLEHKLLCTQNFDITKAEKDKKYLLQS